MSSSELRHAQAPQTALRAAQELLLELRSEGLTWRQIAARPEYQGVAAGTLCDLSHGIEPKSDDARRRLKLATVIVMTEQRACARCSRLFVPNVTWRKLCPVCSPPQIAR